ncbi:hypothetical protein PA25_01370 [Pseudoalteromonas sp. A25]|uniref:hypothetical protein n=1 Tax=Pseudoalteromonas sp. A25 TaxID=116092 RepID=UPI001260C1E7|nr:hypothetical protein [Pseudoalteromonas sp. A25]BBN80152.1 hypothetical protein PA25_01370 [Pseudoalteromonas sp. A25]
MDMSKAIKVIGVIGFGVAIAGCSSTQDTQSGSAASWKDPDMVCESIAQTGSNLRKKRCMSKELADEIRANTKEGMRKLENNSRTVK